MYIHDTIAKVNFAGYDHCCTLSKSNKRITLAMCSTAMIFNYKKACNRLSELIAKGNLIS